MFGEVTEMGVDAGTEWNKGSTAKLTKTLQNCAGHDGPLY